MAELSSEGEAAVASSKFCVGESWSGCLPLGVVFRFNLGLELLVL